MTQFDDHNVPATRPTSETSYDGLLQRRLTRPRSVASVSSSHRKVISESSTICDYDTMTAVDDLKEELRQERQDNIARFTKEIREAIREQDEREDKRIVALMDEIKRLKEQREEESNRMSQMAQEIQRLQEEGRGKDERIDQLEEECEEKDGMIDRFRLTQTLDLDGDDQDPRVPARLLLNRTRDKLASYCGYPSWANMQKVNGGVVDTPILRGKLLEAYTNTLMAIQDTGTNRLQTRVLIHTIVNNQPFLDVVTDSQSVFQMVSNKTTHESDESCFADALQSLEPSRDKDLLVIAYRVLYGKSPP